MTMVVTNMSGHIQKQLTRSLERILEEAYLSGELKLSGRKLKDFPKISKIIDDPKYNLQDIVLADLSKNRFMELPEEITEFPFLERLHLYHNAIRVIPETVLLLQSLSYLDISRNQLTTLPREVCRLPLQTLLVAHNRLNSLPEELGRMIALAELDAGCNEIASLPSRMGDLSRLKSLDLRNNCLVNIPIELTYLKLVTLDISGNRISVLPNELRKMKSLVDLKLLSNPLTSPPAALCIRGRTHIFKYLERQAAKYERARGSRVRRSPLEIRGHVTLDARPHRRYNIENICSVTNSVNKRWSQEINNLAIVLVDQEDETLLDQCESEKSEDLKIPTSTNHRQSFITLSQLENSLAASQNNVIRPVQQIQRNKTFEIFDGEEKRSLNHIQTYREYKEALKQQRVNEGLSIYKAKDHNIELSTGCHNDNTDLTDNTTLTSKQLFYEGDKSNRSIQKVTPQRINCQNVILHNENDNAFNSKNIQYIETNYEKSNSLSKTFTGTSPSKTDLDFMPKLVKTTIGYVEGHENVNKSATNFCYSEPITCNTISHEKYSFTMRREFERAKEEADLVEQLRYHIETRLKMVLPEEMAPALADGVVLCHLANHVKPQSIGSIHVPSPAVPKLTMARCRRNVDNFIEACKKIGVDEEVLLDADAIMDMGYMDAYGLEALGRLVSALTLNAEETIDHQKIGATSARTIQDRVLSTMLFTTFLSTLLLLYLFPIPN